MHHRLTSPTLVVATLWLLSIVTPVYAQLRVVDYNTAGGPRDGFKTIMAGVANESVNGIAKAPDVISLQEQTSSSLAAVVSALNASDLFGAGTYAAAPETGTTSGAGKPGLVYNTNTVSLLETVAFGVVNTSAQARSTLRYELQPVGYDESFYLYSNHYKASTGSSNEARRNVEATALRADLDTLGDGTHALLTGDFNIYKSTEPMWATLTSAGPGQAFDPINRVGYWHDNSSFLDVHSQNPAGSGFVGGGMDDRFDFQLSTGEFLDGEGLSYITGSYHSLGNNGTHTLNGAITTGTGGSAALLNALATVSDHLPVVADYQVPAVLDVMTASIPATLDVGEAFQLDVTVSNAADVLAAIGADELDYTLSATGSLSGSASGTDAALAGGDVLQVLFDTSSPGLKTGSIVVSSGSQGVANGYVEIDVSYEVLAAGLLGDYNEDGIVDAADYSVWRDQLGSPTALPNDNSPGVGEDDYARWKAHFGEMAGDGILASVGAVPEPATVWGLLIGGLAGLTLRRRRR